jgi:hypothetical protein
VAEQGEAPFAVRVECYAGHRGEETPRRFFLGARRIEVSEVLDRWLAPDHRYFRVRGDDGGRYILRHDAVADKWALTLFERGQTR